MDGSAPILRLRPLLHLVVGDHDLAAGGHVDQVARRAIGAVLDRAADHLERQRARLDVMADPLCAEHRIDHFQARDLIDVNAMGAVGGAFAVALEDAALDQDRAACDRAARMPFSLS